MNYLSLEDGSKVEKDLVVKENSLEFIKSKSNDNGTAVPTPKEGNEKIEINARRKWLANKENREKIKLGKDVAVGMEFANGLLGKLQILISSSLSSHLSPLFTTFKSMEESDGGDKWISYLTRTMLKPNHPILNRLQHPLRHPSTPIQRPIPPY